MKNHLVEDWLNSVAYSHSQSKATEDQYKRVWERFSNAIEMVAGDIVADYESSNDRDVMRRHARLIRSWIGKLHKEGLTNTSIKVMVGAVKSFYKYNDLPLGHIPQAMSGIVYHNRDITKDEIVQIMAQVKPREKAFFAVMAQSGLRPHTIKQLRLKHLEDLEKIPCKIEVPQELAKGKYGSYATFIGLDALKYLKQYFATRKNLTSDSLLFCAHDDPKKPVNVKDMSRAFRLAARKLEKSGALEYEIREGKPSELRLYNLRKFFRKYANQMGFENVNYLMGHTVKGSDANYKPQDPEFYRELYAEKAMPFLRLETATPTETEKTIAELKKQLEERDKEIDNMKETITKLQPLVEFVNHFDDFKDLKTILTFFEFKKQLFGEEDTLPEKLRPIKSEFTPYIGLKLKEIAKTMGITEKEALKRLFADDVEVMKKTEERWAEIEKRLKLKQQGAQETEQQ